MRILLAPILLCAGCGASAASGAAPTPAAPATASQAVPTGAVTSLAGAAVGAASAMQLGDAVAIDGPATGAGSSTPLAGAAGDAGAAGGDAAMPANAYCAPVSGWSADWDAYEDAVLALTNQVRAQGATCGGKIFAPAGPLVADPALRCAARAHSMDMAVNGYFAHNDQKGAPPWDRIAAAGYAGSGSQAENILAGMLDPQAVVQGWLHSPGHCSNMMGPKYTKLGVGLFYGTYGMKSYWTQDFGG